MKKETSPKYAEGDKVRTTLNPDDVVTIKGVPSWNGYNWMYAFNETDMRCGEGYIRLEITK
jgi:hypothetical protein